MERQEAIQKLSKIIDQDLRVLADKYGVTVFKGENLNKGWAGQVIEKYLGFSNNTLQAPNAGSWELKLIPLKYKVNGELTVKETMAVTMFNPDDVGNTD